MEDQMVIRNVLAYCQLAELFNVKSLAETTFSCVERCFTMVAELDDFYELNIGLVKKVLGSSHLNVTSEAEVFNAADSWLSFKVKERSKFAKTLLSKIRLCLLSDHAIKHVLYNSKSFSKNDECLAFLKDKDNIIRHETKVKCINRYCSQNKYNILVCGGEFTLTDPVSRKCIGKVVTSEVNQVDGSNFKRVKVLQPMIENIEYFQVVCLKGEAYIFSGYNKDVHKTSFDKYSPSTDSWSRVGVMCDNRRVFCVCAFMNKIFVIGGIYDDGIETNSCAVFDVTEKNWKKVAGINEARKLAACVVFQEKVVVAGGKFDDGVAEDIADEDVNLLNTVESYDYVADEWTFMPNMVSSKGGRHSLVVAQNKLFSIGSLTSFEVFDNTCKQFVTLNLPEKFGGFFWFNKAVSFGNKIYVLHGPGGVITCFDANKNEWSDTEEPFEVTQRITSFSSIVIPSY